MEKIKLFESPIIKNFIKRAVLFVLIALVFAFGGYGIAKLVFRPTYVASNAVVMRLTLDAQNYTTEVSSANNTTLSKYYLKTIIEVIESPATSEAASEIHGYDISFTDVSIQSNDSSLVFFVSYSDKDRSMADLKLNDIITASREQIAEIKPVAMTDLELISSDSGISVAVSSKVKRVTLISGVIGVVFGAAIVYFIYAWNKNKKAQ